MNTTTDPNNVALISSLYSSIGTGDVPTALGLMDEKIIWNEAESNSLADGNPYIGPEAIVAGVFTRLGDMYKSFAIKVVELHDMSNDQVFATLRYEITAKTGQFYDVQAAHHWTLKGGKIVQFQQYVDTKKLAEAE